ncbi:MAG: ABC transporter permease [Prevotellaceae bacterium]|jgi:predicted permease|nr:ABC transporter permease [Prevotellaceae bacterium]
MNIKQSFRIIFRNRIYGVLNVAGLAIGIAAAALVLLWVEYQFNYNKNIPKHKYLYKIAQHQRYGDITHTFFVSPGPLFETLNEEFPDIKCNARFSQVGNEKDFLKDGDLTPVSMYGVYTDSCIFGMLSMEFVKGTAQGAFNAEQSIVISEKMAEALFGKQSPMGETLKDGDGVTYEVTGVFKNFRKGNAFQYDWMIPFRTYEKKVAEKGWANITHWGSNWHTTYVELHPGVDVAQLNEKLNGLAAAKTNGRVNNKYFVYPLDKLRLYGKFEDGQETGGYIRTVQLFFWIGCIILLIACINFMNLSTARSEKRALEVGVRKTFGSRRSRLVRQFMGEAGLITFIALLVAVALAYFCLPQFNRLFGYRLSLDFANPYHYAGLLAIGALCTLLAGSYPAFYLSSFAPLTVLKKLKKPGGSAAWIRKGLVVLQFTMSFVLICATLVMYLQIRHGQDRPLGFVKENVMVFPVGDEIQQRTEVVRQEVLRSEIVEHAGFASNNIMKIHSNGGSYRWQGKAPETDPLISMLIVSPGLLEAVGIRVTEGETFTEAETYEEEGARAKAIINRTLANLMGEAGRVGSFLGQGENVGGHYEIAGIVEDFIFNDIYGKTEPLLIFNYSKLAGEHLFVKLREGVNLAEAQMTIKNILQPFAPNTSFDALFMDDTFEEMFENERLMGRMAALFAGLAIFISCLGLFGLSAFAAEQRTKEIGIRKVMGASVTDILVLLGKNFMLLILVAVAIGLPVAWYVSADWLQSYAYKIALGWGVFAFTMLLISLIALLTVSAQSLRAATANPINAIKTE